MESADSLKTLLNLALSCKTYYKAFIGAKKQILLSRLLVELEDAGVTVSEALTTVKARDLAPYERKIPTTTMTALEEWGDAAWEREGHVNRYLGRSPLKRAVTKQDLTELTANQVIIMMKTQQVITYLVHDYFDRATARHPLTGELQESTHESLALHEKSRLFHAFYRWELWNVLFGIDVDETEFHHEFDFHTCCKWHHGISTHADDQLQMLFGRYKLWEVEAIASVVDHAMIRYYQYFQRLAGKWPEKYRHISYPGGGSPGLSASEKCEPDCKFIIAPSVVLY